MADKTHREASGGILARISAWASSRFRKSDVGRAHDTINPLWQINEKLVEMLHDVARTGNNVMLQYLFNEIEHNDPTLLVCASRRAAALSELDWRVVRADARKMRSADKMLVDEQIACLEEAVSGIDNLPDVIEHLALAPFRGYSAVAPEWNLAGTSVDRCDLLDSWNLCYNRVENVWMWNPDARPWSAVDAGRVSWYGGLQMIAPDQVVLVSKKRAIDWPAMKIYLRIAIGERDWGKFLETYGLPPVILTMPEMTSDDDVDKYMAAAQAVFEGKSGVVPFGTQVSYGSESRGTNPFTDFIEHQQKLIVLMATGGTLTSLAESGSGTLAGGAQMDVWRQIVRSDAKVIGNAINKQLCNLILRRQKDFKGKPHLAEFQFETEPPKDPKEIAELASTFSSAGYEMDADELAQKTGYKLRLKQEAGGMGFNAEHPPSGPSDPPPSHEAEIRHQDAPEETGAQPPVINARSAQEAAPARNTAAEDLARSLQMDFKVVADRVNEILALPEEERPAAAARLLGELERLVPDDPAMAEVIAEQMQSAFKSEIGNER